MTGVDGVDGVDGVHPPDRSGGSGRVALVGGSTTGGIGRHVHTLVGGLVSRGWAVRVYAPVEVERQFRYAAAGATVTALELPATPGPRDAGVLSRLYRGLRADPVEVIHAHGLRAGAVLTLVRPPGVPLVVTWHVGFTASGLRRVTHTPLARSVARAADVTIGVSTAIAATAARMGARDVRLIMAVAPPLPAPTRARAEVVDDLGLAPLAPIVLAVGRLHEHKRHDVLVAAAARWRSLRPRPAVVIAGQGPAFRTLVAQATVARAPVHLVGHRGDVADLLHAADLAVVTSAGEGSPLFVQEALSAGVALVATAVGGVVDLADGAAELVPPADVDALDRVVRALLADPGRRAVLRAAGLARAATWPAVSEMVDQVERVYTDLIAGLRSRSGRASGSGRGDESRDT